MAPTPLTLPRAQAPLPVAGGNVFTQEPNRPEATSSMGFASMLNERMQARAEEGERSGSREHLDPEPSAQKAPAPGGARPAEAFREAGSPGESARATQPDESPRASQPSPDRSGRAAGRQGDSERSGPQRRLSGERPAGDRGSRLASSQPDPAGSARSASTGPAEEGLASSTGAGAGLRPGEGELSRAGDPGLFPATQAESPATAPLPGSAAALALAGSLGTTPATPGPAFAEASSPSDGVQTGAGARSSAGHAYSASGATATALHGGFRAGAAALAKFSEAVGSDAALPGSGSGWDLRPTAADPAEAGIHAQPLPGLPASIGPASLPVVPGLPAGLEAMQALAPAEAASGGSAPTPSLQLATPVTAPDFSRALAAQLTTWASGGVQEATLQLNPADMGPIAVSIMLDGALAQIDFAAAHAQTRQVIEAGLPSLAAALHGAGLTLAGGGVFEQRPGSQQRGPQDGSAPQGAGRLAAAEGGSARDVAVRRQTVLGLVDTYA